MNPPRVSAARVAIRKWLHWAIAPAPAVRRALWGGAFIVVLAGLFASVSLPSEVNLRAGEVAPATVQAPHTFIDRPATAAVQNAAVARVRPVYTINATTSQQVMARFDADLQRLVNARQEVARAQATVVAAHAARSVGTASRHVGQGLTPATETGAPRGGAVLVSGRTGAAVPAATSNTGRASATAHATGVVSPPAGVSTPSAVAVAATVLRRALGLQVPATAYRAVLTARRSAFDGLAGAARATLQATLAGGVRISDLPAARARLNAVIATLPGGDGVATFLGALDARDLAANDFLNGPATDEAMTMARTEARPVMIEAGQVIVREGDRVTAQEIAQLRDAGMLRAGGPAGALLTSLLIAAALCALTWAYFRQSQRDAASSAGGLPLFLSILCLTAAAVRLTAPLSPFLAPVTWGAMLVAVAFGQAPALFAAALGGLTGGLLDGSLAVAAAAMVSAWVGVLSMRRLHQRADLLRAGLYAALGGAAAVGLIRLFAGQEPLVTGLLGSQSAPVWRDIAAAAASGLLSGALAVGTLPYVEYLGFLTPFKLLELGNPAQPLLRRLLVEAPGTYHHSLMVANLAEAACQAVGGDALLVRAGAYYHDIGKLKRPHFFAENQMGGINPHDQLPPTLSAMVIKSHVRDGLELARSARLPPAIVAFIATHHGTTLLSYFYRRAQEQASAQGGSGSNDSGAASQGEPGSDVGASRQPLGTAVAEGQADGGVSEERFRYDGPRPESRETAIVMLADGVEAAVRSLGRPTPERIAEMVERVVAARLAERQLDKSALTLGEVDQVKATFLRILVGVYHTRVEYPEQLERAVLLGSESTAVPVPRQNGGGLAGQSAGGASSAPLGGGVPPGGGSVAADSRLVP